MCLPESPFAKYLHTNHVPSNDQVEGITSFLKEPKERLANLQTEIRKLSSILESLQTQHDALSNAVDEHDALLHPIRRIPQEILQEVFSHCLPTDRNPTVSPEEAPTLLTRICSNWRMVALSTPSLWARIHIAVPDFFKFYNPHRPYVSSDVDSSRARRLADLRAEALTVWVSRSGACPLSISLFSANPAQDGAEKAIDAMLSVSHRWQRMELNASLVCAERILNIDPAEVPGLKAIKIRGPLVGSWTIDYEEQGLSTRRIFSAPTIRDIALELSSDDPLLFPLDWPSITHFTKTGNINGAEHGFTIQKAMTLVTKCSNLVSCHLEICQNSSEPVFYGKSSIFLPKLESLWFHESTDCQGLVERLELPVLHKLTFFTYVSWRSQPTLLTFLRNCSGSLHTLVTNPTVMEKSSIIACLRSVPNLRKLDLRTFHMGAPTPPFEPLQFGGTDEPTTIVLDFDDEILRLMSLGHTNGEGPLCPKLETFYYITTRGGKFCDHVILDFVRSRLTEAQPQETGDGRLRSVAMVVDKPPQLDIKRIIQSVAPDDFVFKIKYEINMNIPQFPLNAGSQYGSFDDLDVIFAESNHSPAMPFMW